ncbi:MAG: DNA-3-methyladenine glycosylase I [Hyphomicrobiaceae bacterium]|nr:DNA-3-methyladenine glycosylase I [Hyphomicrobiaceae bacterium]
MHGAKAGGAAVGVTRCPWPGISDDGYARYHDEEWGVPLTGEWAILEKLILEGFQSGLSWLTILRKRPAFRAAFAGFDPEIVAGYGERDVARLLADAGIVRHKGKIEAAIGNARAVLALRASGGLEALVWRHAPPTDKVDRGGGAAAIPAETEASRRLSKALKAAGFRFVGPTTAYAFMQSAGLVNDHVAGCFRREDCRRLQTDFRRRRGIGGATDEPENAR